MRRSVRRRVAITFILLVAVLLLAIGIFLWLFMDDIYFREKRKSILTSWEMINAADDAAPGEDFTRFCQVNGLDYCVTDSNLNALHANTQSVNIMLGRLFGNVLGKEDDNTEILQQTERYRLIRIHDRFQTIDYLELWGVLENGNYYMVHSPIQSISEAAAISVRVFIVLGLIGIGIGAAVIMLVTRRIARPIRELTEISQRMTDLDFQARYTSGGEDEIGELGRNFNTMSERLRDSIRDLQAANEQLERDIEEKTAAEKRGREFIANVSHELKTPIALIQGYAEGLRDNVNDDAESRAFYSEVIIDEANKMNHLVRQLLTLDQLESGREELSQDVFDLVGLIHGVLASAELLIEQCGAEVEVETEGASAVTDSADILVTGDEFKIEEVVTNFLNNALHHLRGEKKIRITCAVSAGIVTTTFFNTGDPIPAKDLPRIWEKFFKVDKAHSREYGGSGIGLSIVKAIMDAHGQRCGAENVPGGVMFYFTLPLAK